MNKLQTTLVFGAIFASVLGTVAVNGLPISQFVAPMQYENAAQGIMMNGHVEMITRDFEGNIKQYAQGDNMIVETGADCIAAEMFSGGTVGLCATLGNWDYIAIGNGTSSTIAVSDERLDESSADDGLAISGSVHNGEMARKQVTPSFNTAGTNNIVTLANTGNAFTFTATNATTVTQAGLYNAGGTPNSNGETTALGGELLAAKDLSPTVAVTSGDSLTVTWTVTVGSG